MLSKALTDSDTIASPQSDAPRDGNLLPAPSAPGPQDVSGSYLVIRVIFLPLLLSQDAFPSSFVSAVPTSHATSAWPFEPGHFAHPMTPYVDGNGDMLGTYLNFPSTVGATSWVSSVIPLYGSDVFTHADTSCYSWVSVKHRATPLGAEDTVAGQVMSSGTYMPALPRTSPGKRPRGAESTSNDFIQVTNGSHRSGPARRVKRKMRRNGVLEAAGSTSRARQKPADRTLSKWSDKSEAAGRGAGMLAAPIAHEVYHQTLKGPSVQEALMGTTAQGQPPWIEGSEERMTLDFTDNAVGQLDVVNAADDGEGDDAEEDGFRIPKGLDERHQRLLMATPEERARGVVRVLKCVVCPKAGFRKWDNFIRHCDRTEAHPVTFVFCRFCGDFFSRPEARKRHEERPPKECSLVSPAKAEEKRVVTLKVHEGYMRELDAYLMFGGKMGEPFVQRIIKLYPDSSKRRSRQQNRLKA